MPWLLKQKEQTMLKTLFATTALATMLAWSAQAQTQPAPADDATTTPPILENEMAPDAEMTSRTPTRPRIPPRRPSRPPPTRRWRRSHRPPSRPR